MSPLCGKEQTDGEMERPPKKQQTNDPNSGLAGAI
jgi:hypothetical protein